VTLLQLPVGRGRRSATPAPVAEDEALERLRDARPTLADPASSITERTAIASMNRISRGLHLIAAAIVLAAIILAVS
jgi:hypothetical protein